jgi:hypothetical protein
MKDNFSKYLLSFGNILPLSSRSMDLTFRIDFKLPNSKGKLKIAMRE